jgi:hypothetical protein
MEAEDKELAYEPPKIKPRSGIIRQSTRIAHSYDPRPRSYKLLSNCETLGHEQLKSM